MTSSTHHDGAAAGGGVEQGTSALRPDLIGYALHLSWICLLFYNVAPNAIGKMQTITSPTDPLYMVSTISLCLTLLCGMVMIKPFMRMAESRVGVLVAPAITSLGTLAFCHTFITGTFLPALIVVGGILTGVGSAVMAARWASVFGNSSSRAFVVNLTPLLASTAIICMATSYLPDALTYAVIVMLPIAAGACLQYARAGGARSDSAPADHRATPRKPFKPATLAVLGLFITLLGGASGALPRFAESVEALSRIDLVFYLIAAVLLLVFTAALVLMEDRRAFAPMFLLPLALLAVFLLPFSQFVVGDGIAATYSIGQASFELMLFFGAVLFALLFDLSPARTFMVARVALAVSDMFGSIVAGMLVVNADANVGILVASVAILSASELVIVALVTFYLIERRNRLAAQGTQAAEKPMEAAFVRAETAAAGNGGATATRGNIAAADSPVAAGNVMEGGASVAREADAPKGAPGPASRVERLADDYGLSPRERDVLSLLALGRTSAQIQDELFISQGTANYHMRNIYAKLGVHSRQELLLLAMGAQVEESGDDRARAR